MAGTLSCVATEVSAPGGNRTPNQPGRSRLLYPLSYGRQSFEAIRIASQGW